MKRGHAEPAEHATGSHRHEITFNIPTPGQGGSYTPTTIDLQPASFGLYAVGELSFNKGPVSFVMAGVFDIDFEDESGAQAYAEVEQPETQQSEQGGGFENGQRSQNDRPQGERYQNDPPLRDGAARRVRQTPHRLHAE